MLSDTGESGLAGYGDAGLHDDCFTSPNIKTIRGRNFGSSISNLRR